MKIGLDVDDVLFECNKLALDIANFETKTFVSFQKISDWNMTDVPALTKERMLEIYNRPEFYVMQKPYRGAVEFVDSLLDAGHDVYFVTAVYLEHMSTRARMLRKHFPRVTKERIIMCSDKTLLSLDVLLDDKCENLMGNVRYPVIFDRPWNRNILTNIRRVASYDEFLVYITAITSLIKKGEKYEQRL